MIIPWINSEKLSEDTTLWRYMDIIKFLDLIQNKQLYFSNIEGFNDPYEGFISPEFKKYEMEKLSSLEDKEFYEKNQKEKLKNYFISCWNADKNENASMWLAYSNKDNGIAIKTNISKLINSIALVNYKNNQYKKSFVLGKVLYVGKDDLTENNIKKIQWERLLDNLPKILFYKSVLFKSENEVRVILKKDDCNNNFFKVNINLRYLIDEIYIVPTAKKYYVDIVNNLVQKYIGPDIKIKKNDFLR